MYVGIDFSKNKADFAVHREDGRPLTPTKSFANNRSGYEQAKTLLLQIFEDQEAEGIDLAGEATSYYWLPMFTQFFQDPDFQDKDLAEFLLNARWVRWFKKSKPTDHKDDPIDAGEISEYIRFHRDEVAWQYDQHWMPLRFYTRLRLHLSKSLTRSKNLFDLYLFLAYPTYARRRTFSDPLGQTSQALLSEPERLAELGQWPLEQLAEHLDELSRHHLPDPAKNAQRLLQVLSERFVPDESLAKPIWFGLERLLETIAQLEDQIAQVDAKIAAQVATDYPEVAWLDSIPGIGPVWASGIAAEIGDLKRFTEREILDRKTNAVRKRTAKEVVAAIGKYAGLWWPKNASGQFEAEERRLSREGNAYLRYYILEAADCMRLHIPSFRRYYESKFVQAHKHKHKRALVLTGCKALDLFVALLRHQTAYQAREGQDIFR